MLPSIFSFLLLLFLKSLQCRGEEDYTAFPPPCDSPIYCYGSLLETVQLAGIYDDSKTFVDFKMKLSTNKTLSAFKNSNLNTNSSKEDIKAFVEQYFEEVDAIEGADLKDHKNDPNFLNDITNATVKAFAQELINIWPSLARQVTEDAEENSDLYSFIPVPNNFVIPGGRFKEYYYWDSYWVIEGLLISEMYDTARGMIDNFLYLVNKFGFIPNGGRIYYLNRSQPPLLSSMVALYYEYTKDIEWLKTNIDIVAKELNFWLENRTVTVETETGKHNLARYYSSFKGPRPESYSEDYKTSSLYLTENLREKVNVELKAGAESGWDFSSRWLFDDKGDVSYSLSDIQTSRVIPVDLNSFLCGGFRSVSNLYGILGEDVQSKIWEGVYKEWVESITSVLYDSEQKIWLDYDVELKRHRNNSYPTSVTPLWAGCFLQEQETQLTRDAYNYLIDKGLLNYLGGIPTSQLNTTQQWDFPNAWPPLQHIVVYSLVKHGIPEADEWARKIVKKWMDANIIGFLESGEMFEKYDANNPGEYGGGGEYTVQSGFGWTNGIALKFINDFYRS